MVAVSNGVSRNLVVDSDPEPAPERRVVRRRPETQGPYNGDHRTLLGVPLQKAKKYLPDIPDQGMIEELWFLTMTWFQLAFTYHGVESTLRTVVHGVHGALRIALAEGLDDRDVFHTLPREFKTAQSVQLMEEFGLPEFFRAILSVSLFYLFFLHQDQYHLYPLVREALGMIKEWYETFIRPRLGR